MVSRLVALFAFAAVLFNAPLLRSFGGSAFALFLAWAAVIAVVAWWMERGAPDDDGEA